MNDLDYCVKTLQSSGVVICPTEGIYGFSCALDCKKAVKRIYNIKQRDISKSLIILASDFNMAMEYIQPNSLTTASLQLLEKNWPGPHTFIVKASEKVPEYLLANDLTIAIRVTDFIYARYVIEKLNKPIISTSANISNQPYVHDLEHIEKEFSKKVDYILKLPCGGSKKPSSIYNLITSCYIRE